jgi:hypothetical protein
MDGMVHVINVPLSEEAAQALAELSRRELRRTQDQAALLVLDGLRRAGLYRDSTSDTKSLRGVANRSER